VIDLFLPTGVSPTSYYGGQKEFEIPNARKYLHEPLRYFLYGAASIIQKTIAIIDP